MIINVILLCLNLSITQLLRTKIFLQPNKHPYKSKTKSDFKYLHSPSMLGPPTGLPARLLHASFRKNKHSDKHTHAKHWNNHKALWDFFLTGDRARKHLPQGGEAKHECNCLAASKTLTWIPQVGVWQCCRSRKVWHSVCLGKVNSWDPRAAGHNWVSEWSFREGEEGKKGKLEVVKRLCATSTNWMVQYLVFIEERLQMSAQQGQEYRAEAQF